MGIVTGIIKEDCDADRSIQTDCRQKRLVEKVGQRKKHKGARTVWSDERKSALPIHKE